MGMSIYRAAKYESDMERRVMEVINRGIREKHTQLQILAERNKVMAGLREGTPKWVASHVMGVSNGAITTVGNFMVISGYRLKKTWRGSLFLRTWGPMSSQGKHEPKLEVPVPYFRDVQNAEITFGQFEKEYVEAHGFYWPTRDICENPRAFSEHPSTLVSGNDQPTKVP